MADHQRRPTVVLRDGGIQVGEVVRAGGQSYLHFKTIHDACKPRVDLLGSHWRTPAWRRPN
jgi:hypothetical protein